MRLQFDDIDTPKTVAKRLARLSDQLQLTTVHEALARALGYRDWHELAKSGTGLGSALTDSGHRNAIDIIGRLADELGQSDADVQYVTTTGRLFGPQAWSVDEQLAARGALWRGRLFGPPARHKPGTVVRMMVGGRRDRGPAYLKLPGRPTYVVNDNGVAALGDFEAVTPRSPLPDFVPLRLWVPYGFWTLRDGTKVIFSRDYFPMWRVGGRPRGAARTLVLDRRDRKQDAVHPRDQDVGLDVGCRTVGSAGFPAGPSDRSVAKACRRNASFAAPRRKLDSRGCSEGSPVDRPDA